MLRSSILALAVLSTGVTAINNGLAITPPMGWVRRAHTIIFEQLANDIRITGMPLAATSRRTFSSPRQRKS
jgi:hypothetical protein